MCNLVGNVTVCILGNAAFTRKPNAHQNGECGTVVTCDVRARGQYILCVQRQQPVTVLILMALDTGQLVNVKDKYFHLSIFLQVQFL